MKQFSLRRCILVAAIVLAASPAPTESFLFHHHGHHHHHGLFSRICHGIGHVFHEAVHGVEHFIKEDVKVVKKIGHEIGHLAKEAEHAVVHVVEDVVHAAKKVVKVIVKIVKKAELALLKINDKLFGPMLGPIMDKLEMALIESIPGVGQVVKVVVEGVDIADKVDAVGKCWKARDFGCVGNAVGGIVEDVSGAMTNKAGHMSSFAKTVVNDGKFVETACVVAKDVYETYDALDDVVKVIKHHGKPGEIIQALGDLGGVLGDVDKSLSDISSTKKGLLKNVATALDKGVGFVEKGDKIIVGALDVAESFTKLKQCLDKPHHKRTPADYECAGSSVAEITNALGQELTWVDPAMSGLANKIINVGNDISKVDDAAVGAYNTYLEFKGAMGDFKWPGSVIEVENSVKDLGTSLSYLAGSVSTLTGGKASRFQAVCNRLVEDVNVFQNGDPKKGPIGKAGAIMVAGIDITEKYKEAKACTGKDGTVAQKSRYVQCLSNAVSGIVGPLDKAFGGDSTEMHQILGEISKISTGVSEVSKAALGAYNSYHELKGAMGDFKWPGSVTEVENSVKDLGTSLSYLAGSVSGLTGAKSQHFQAVCNLLVQDVNVFQNADPKKGPIGKAGAIMVAGIDITQKYKEAKACTGKGGTIAEKSAYLQCLSNAVNGIVGPLDKAFGSDSTEMHQIISEISKVNTGVAQVNHAALGAYNSYLELKGSMGEFKWPGTVPQVEKSVQDLGKSMSYLAGSVSTLTGAKASRFQSVCDRLVSDVTVFENANPKKGPIGKAGAIMVAGIDITEKYKEAKACTGKDGTVAEKSAYVECVGTAVNGIVGPLSKALGGESGNMKKIIGGISKIGNTMVKVGDVGVELSGDYYKLDNILKSVERDHSTKNLEAQAKALGAALAQTVTDVTLGHVDGQAMWQGVCRKLQQDIKIITSPKTKSGKVNVFGVALDVGAVLVEASIALKHKDYPKIGALLQKIFSAVGLKLESETAACKNAMNGVEVTVAGIPITLHGKGPLLGNQLFQGYEDIKHAFTDVLRIPTPEHVRWYVSNITHMLSEDVKNHVFTPDTPPAALWDGLLETLENATFMELSSDGKTVQRLVLAGEDEVDLLGELKAFGAKLFNGDLEVKDVLNGVGLGLPAKYQFSSVYVPLARRNLRTGQHDRRRAFLFHHHHHHAAPPPKINCEGKWGKWSTCSASCGTHGTRVRSFIVSKSPQNGGKACPKTTTEACNRFACPKPATSASLLKGLFTKAGAAMTSQTKLLHEVMEALNKGTSSSKYKLNVLTVPKKPETDPANTVLAAAAFRSLALSMETAYELSRLSDTKAKMPYNETSYLVYEFTADFADALDKLSEFAPSSQHTLWAEVASSMELATVAHPEKNDLGLKLLTAASKKDLMPYIMSAGRHWRAKKYTDLGSDITAIFVEAWAQTGVSSTAVHQIMVGIGSGLPESASGLYNEFGFAFKHLSSRDYPGVEHDPSLPEVVIPDVETHGVMRLASAMNETVYTTASVPTKLKQQITQVALALRHAKLTQDKQGRLVSVTVTTLKNRNLDIIQQLTHAWTAWEKKDYSSVGKWLSIMTQSILMM